MRINPSKSCGWLFQTSAPLSPIEYKHCNTRKEHPHILEARTEGETEMGAQVVQAHLHEYEWFYLELVILNF